MTLLKHLVVEHVLDEADQQVDLRNDDEYLFSEDPVNDQLEHALENHEDRGQRRSELVRKSHLAQTEGLVPLLLQNDFLAQLQRLDVICNVVEINCGARLLQELDALHTGLVKLLEVFGPVLELENAVLLVGLVLLGQDDLLETHGLADLHL